MAMDNAAEQYDLITVLWRLEFKGIDGEIRQGHPIDEVVATNDTGRMGRLRKLFASLQRLMGAVAANDPRSH
jgi:hypothetical protein